MTWTRDFCAANSAWAVLLWGETELREVLQRHKAVERCFDDAADLREKSDIARLELLRQYGGVFLDADSIWLGRRLEPLLALAASTGFFASLEPGNGQQESKGFDDEAELRDFETFAPGAEALIQNGFF